jgi:Fructose-1,6-bisphosphate aldolase
MILNNIEEIATFIVEDGKGILAADESNPTCGKRFDSIGGESTEKKKKGLQRNGFLNQKE